MRQFVIEQFSVSEIASETWRVIPEWDEYDASNLGRIRRRNATMYPAGKILKPHLHEKGYLQVGPCQNGKNRKVRVHKLVAQAFLGERPKGMTVNHKDTVKTNNRASNLEYLSDLDNKRHAIARGRFHTEKRRHHDPLTVLRGDDHPSSKISEPHAREVIALIREGLTLQVIAARYGISRSAVDHIKKKRTWRHLYEAV
jgi:hypothetical protein